MRTSRPIWPVVLEGICAILAAGWIAYLIARPVYVATGEFGVDVTTHNTEALSGAKGQTFLTTSDRLGRIDVWLDTQVVTGSSIFVRFELVRGGPEGEVLASASATFDRSRDGWPVQLRFDPDLTRAGEALYLRMVSDLGQPVNHLFFRYTRVDVYPAGELLDSDRIEAAGQDLVFHQFRVPTLPKPLAWGEALLERMRVAAIQARADQPVLLGTILAVLVGGIAVVLGLAARAAVRVVPWTQSPLTYPAVGLTSVALCLLVLFVGELPFGTVVLTLS